MVVKRAIAEVETAVRQQIVHVAANAASGVGGAGEVPGASHLAAVVSYGKAVGNHIAGVEIGVIHAQRLKNALLDDGFKWLSGDLLDEVTS